MGIYSDAVDKAGKRLRDQNRFKYKTIMIRGEPYEPLIPEDEMLRILQFKGTGEKKKFTDAIKEAEALIFNEFVRAIKNDVDFRRTPWLDEYIIENNFQIIFEKDDVIVRKSKVA